jgi:hypothetical protein
MSIRTRNARRILAGVPLGGSQWIQQLEGIQLSTARICLALFSPRPIRANSPSALAPVRGSWSWPAQETCVSLECLTYPPNLFSANKTRAATFLLPSSFPSTIHPIITFIIVVAFLCSYLFFFANQEGQPRVPASGTCLPTLIQTHPKASPSLKLLQHLQLRSLLTASYQHHPKA